MNEVVRTDELQKEISPVIHQANQIVVISVEQYEFAAGFLKEIKNAQTRVLNFFEPIKKKAYDTWKTISSKESEIIQPLKNAEQTVKQKILKFQQEKEAERLAEQRRLQAEAEERARKERERLIKKAESLKTPELKEQRLQEAQEIDAPVITVQSEQPKVSGISTRKIWKAIVEDKKVFIEASLKDENLMAFIEIDIGKLNKLAVATKGQISYPGIKFYEESILSAGGK